MNRDVVGGALEILLVEDSLLDARLSLAALAGSGLRQRTTLVRDGREAWEFLQRVGRFARAPRPDVVLLDLLLPHKNGLELLAEIRQTPTLADLPVIVLTGSDDEADRTTSAWLQVDAFLTKPIHRESFITALRQLRGRGLEKLLLPLGD